MEISGLQQACDNLALTFASTQPCNQGRKFHMRR